MTEPSHVLVEQRAPMAAKEPDRDVVERCRRGDRDALRELFEAHGDRVYSIARHFFSGDESVARDVTQDVFVKVMDRIAHFEGSSRFSTWLYRLTVNACFDERRRGRRLVLLDAVPDRGTTGAPQAAAVDDAESAAVVRGALAALTPPLRAVVLLRYFEGLSYEEIGLALERSPGTVASRLNRAHAVLARTLGVLREPSAGGE